MPISFMVKEAREQLENTGMVYTLRSHFRSTGKNEYNHFKGDTKKGDVYIEFVGDYKGSEQLLQRYVVNSGFKSLEEWLKKAKKSRYLYRVMLT